MSGARHADPRSLAVVAAGGTIGVALRESALLILSGTGIPWAVLGANLSGAFALGLLLELLTHLGRDSGRRRDLRLFLGTGVLGGYTTYSALALDTVRLADSAGPVTAVAYGLGSVIAGVACAWAGVTLGAWLVARRSGVRP